MPRLTPDPDFWRTVSNGSRSERGETDAVDIETARRIAIWRDRDGLDEATWAAIESHVRGDHVVDFGCGFGRVMKVALERGHDVTGVDIDRHMIERCVEYTGVRPLHIAEWEATGETADTIYSVECIQHIGGDVLSRVSRLFDRRMRRGSRLIVIGEPIARDWAIRHSAEPWVLVHEDADCLPQDPLPRWLAVWERL